jgi:diguanylate cyclase (GGDEF)-like protein
MAAAHPDRRVLVAAHPADADPFLRLFAGGPLYGWEARVAHSVTQARFLLQHDPCDALLLDEGLYRREGPEGLDWLGTQREVPAVFLAGEVPELVLEVLGRGVEQWLPRNLALNHASLLAASLDQAVRGRGQARRLRAAGEALHACRRQVSRLVNLLWESSPSDTPWLSQRHMLERLHEEIARADRQGGPFAVALGDVQPEEAASAGRAAQAEEVASWTAEHVRRVKRRADVAGRYGTRGFMVLLVQTPEDRAALGCRRLQQCLEHQALSVRGLGEPVRVLFGVAGYSPTARSPKAILGCAERRLEEARSGSGAGLVCGPA